MFVFARFEAYSLGMKDDCAILQLIKIQKEIDARSRDALANYNKDVVHEKQMAFHRAQKETDGFSEETARGKPSAAQWNVCGLQGEFTRFGKIATTFSVGW